MFRLHKLILSSLAIFMIAALTACNLGQAVEPTPTPVDVTAIYLAAVATAQAQMTLNAPTITVTLPPTLPPSETPPGAVTNTPGIVPIEETSALTLTSTATLPLGATTLTPTQTALLGATALPSFTPVTGAGSGGSTSVPGCKSAQFVADMSIPDGTVFAPGTKFTKTWKIKNTGTCRWDEGFFFAAWSGPPSMGANKGPLFIRTVRNFIDPDETVDMSINMVAPDAPGDYVAHWQMYDDLNKPFGGDFTVVIKVVK